MGIGDWGLGIGDWAQSPIPNPQSPIPNPQSPFNMSRKYFYCLEIIYYIMVSQSNGKINIFVHGLNSVYYNEAFLQNILDVSTEEFSAVPFVKEDYLKATEKVSLKQFIITSTYELEKTEIILKKLDLENHFTLIDKLDPEIAEINIIVSHDMKFLQTLQDKNFILIFNFLILNDNESYISLQQQNCEIYKVFKPHLIVESLRQLTPFIKFVTENSNLTSSQEILAKFLGESINVLYIFDSKSKSKNYRKREVVKPNTKINFIPFMHKNVENFSLKDYPNDIKIFLQRSPYFYFTNKDVCLTLQNQIEERGILSLHKMSVIDTCFYRYNLSCFLKDFAAKIEDQVLSKHGLNFKVPTTFLVKIKEKEVEKFTEQFKTEITSRVTAGEINYPIVIKTDACIEHEMYLVLSEAGIDGIIKENHKKIFKYDDLVLQQFIPHGGVLYKTYFLNGKNYTTQRPSIPNLEGETLKQQHFQNENFKFHNEFLYAKKDPSFWENYKETKVNLNFTEIFDEISHKFVEESKLTLFGLDFLYEESMKTIFILEVNYFPSYRETGVELGPEFTEHLLYSYDKLN